MDPRLLLLAAFVSVSACERRSTSTNPDASSSRGDVFAGCEEQLNGPTSRIYRCGSLLAEVREERPSEPKILVDGALAIPRGFFAGSEERVSIVLDGVARDVVRLSGWQQNREVVVFAVGVPTEDHGARLAVCMVDRDPANERRCRDMLAFFVEKGSRDGAIARPPALDPPAFVGKPLVVPEGCELQQSNAGGGAIHCKDGAGGMQWFVASHDAVVDQWVDAKVEAYKLEFNQVVDGVPELMSETFDCAIDGVAAQCVMLLIGTTGWAYLGSATVRGQPAAVLCSHVGFDPNPSAVCNGLID